MSSLITDTSKPSANLPLSSEVSDAFHPPRLPGVSPKFFTFENSPAQRGLSSEDHYIYFSRTENLPPHKIQDSDFPRRPSQPIAASPAPKTSDSKQTTSSPNTHSKQTAVMSTADPDYDESSYKSLKSVGEKMNLNKDEMKALGQEVIKFIERNEIFCRRSPRPWKSQMWKDLIRKFLEDSNRGAKIWAANRKSASTTDDLTWPVDKDLIIFLTFMLVKIECTKYFKAGSKRKLAVAEDEPASKKPKLVVISEEDEEDSSSSEDETPAPIKKKQAVPSIAETNTGDSSEESESDEETSIAEEPNLKDMQEQLEDARSQSNRLDMHVDRSVSPPLNAENPAVIEGPKPMSPGLGSSFVTGGDGFRSSATLKNLSLPSIDTHHHETYAPVTLLDDRVSDAAIHGIDHEHIAKINKLPMRGYNSSQIGNPALLHSEGFQHLDNGKPGILMNNTPSIPHYGTGNNLTGDGKGSMFLSYGHRMTLPMTPLVSGGPFEPNLIHHQDPFHTPASAKPHRDSDGMIFCVLVEGLKLSPSRLMTFSGSKTFAEFYGQTILESSDAAKAGVATANQCKVQIPGENKFMFSLRDASREILWSSLMKKASRAVAGHNNGDLIEVEFSENP